MKHVLIFTDRHGRRWVTGQTLSIVFGIRQFGVPRWWNYDLLLRWCST